MKKVYLFLNLLLVTSLAFAQLPQSGKNYNIKNVGANLYLSYVTNDWNVSRINEPSGDADQVWRLVATDVADVFNLSYDGQYLTKHPNNGWDNVLTTDPTTDAAKFVLTEAAGGITIQLLANRGTALYYAPQQANAGSSVYLNSTAANNWELWVFEEVVEPEVLEVKTLTPNAGAVEVAYNAPISVLFTKDIVAGDLSGITIKDAAGVALENVTATVLNARLSIQHANFTFGKTYTVTVPVGTITDYTQVITWSFTVANPVLPVDFRAYIIKNATTGFYLTAPEVAPATDSGLKTTNKLAEEGKDNDPTQVFRFTNPDPSNPDVFNISVSGKFLSKVANSAWASTFTEDPTSDLAKFVVTPEGVGVKIQALSQGVKTQYLAPNNLNIDIPCYFDKTANFTWVLEQVVEPIAIYKTTPANNATVIALNAPVEGIFNQSITAGDLTSVTIKDEAGVPVAGVVATLNNNTISIAHADFDFETTYTVTIPQEAIEGLGGAINWSFTTKAGPSVESTTPINDATNVAVNVSIKALFTETAIATNLTGIVVTDAEGNKVEDVVATLSETVLSITHPVFNYATKYTVTIPTGTIKGINNPYEWSFTTTAAPQVTATTPVNNATNVALATLIRISFNKVIFAENLNGISVTDDKGNHVGDVISVTGSALNIAHLALSNSTVYTVTVPANSIKGVTEEIKFSFTTENTAGINDLNNDSDITIYPSVSKGSITVNTAGDAILSVFDITGVNLANYQLNGGSQKITLDYPNGLYIIKVDKDDCVYSHKVILQK